MVVILNVNLPEYKKYCIVRDETDRVISTFFQKYLSIKSEENNHPQDNIRCPQVNTLKEFIINWDRMKTYSDLLEIHTVSTKNFSRL